MPELNYEIIQTNIAYENVKEIRTELSDKAWQENMSSLEAGVEGVKDAWNSFRVLDPFNSGKKAINAAMRNRNDSITKEDYRLLLTLLNPIAPHITEELNEELGFSPICEGAWPKYDEEKTIDKEKEIGAQVNGKIRASIKVSIDESEEVTKDKALKEENVKKHIDGKEIVKIIVLKGRIVNIVVK